MLEHSCINCAKRSCGMSGNPLPEHCQTTQLSQSEIDEVNQLYLHDEEINKIFVASTEAEITAYGKLTRVEEIVAFAKRIGAKKIGLAACAGLMRESQIFAKILEHNGFDVYGVTCKIGAVDKHRIGIQEEYIREGRECICNPIMQAKLLNKHKVDLNVVIGLCVGHDGLFYRYAEGLTTTLITKDRITGHNPAAPLYTAYSFYESKLYASACDNDKQEGTEG